MRPLNRDITAQVTDVAPVPHTQFLVWVQFMEPSHAQAAVTAFQGRFYAKRQVRALMMV